MRNVSLVAIKAEQPIDGWQRLEHALSAELREIDVARNPRGLTFTTLAIVIGAGIVYNLTYNHKALTQAMKDLFQL